jgi:hypothetical protein
MMSAEEAKSFVRRHFEEFVNRQDLSAADRNFAPDYREHGADVPPGLPPVPFNRCGRNGCRDPNGRGMSRNRRGSPLISVYVLCGCCFPVQFAAVLFRMPDRMVALHEVGSIGGSRMARATSMRSKGSR